VFGGGGGYQLTMSNTVQPAKRYTKKIRQAVVSSSLDPLGLPAAVTRAFVCKKLVLRSPPHRKEGDGVCVQYESRQVMIDATAAFSPNGSNWGGRGGCLGFLVYLFCEYNTCL
jgi:hypothetical protein